MFDGVVIAPARLLGAVRNSNPINEQGHLPFPDQGVVIQDRFQDQVGKHSHNGPKHIHSTGVITPVANKLMERDTLSQAVSHATGSYNLVSFPFTAPEPTFEEPIAL